MSYRPYPDVRRAARQMRRATAVDRCLVCRHSVSAHALVDGVRTCTRAVNGGPAPSCELCALRVKEAPLVAMLYELGMQFRMPVSGRLDLVGGAVYRD